jgi:predicted nucleic acid-binding protein
MARDVFLDTSGLYAFLVKRDGRHEKASAAVRAAVDAGGRVVTTGYVVDETATLLKARGYAGVLGEPFNGITLSDACRIEWMDHGHFARTKALFLKHADHRWSFTDSFSFVVMKQAGLKQAVTSDAHFREAGFVPLLA